MPVFPANQEAEARGHQVQGQLGQLRLSQSKLKRAEAVAQWWSVCLESSGPWVQSPVMQKDKTQKILQAIGIKHI